MRTKQPFEHFIGGIALAAMGLGVFLVLLWFGVWLASLAGWMEPAPYTFVSIGISLIFLSSLVRLLTRARA